MDLQNLKENAGRIIDEYSNELNKDTARHIRYEISWLLSKAGTNTWDSLEDAYEERISLREYSIVTKRNIKDYFSYICKKLYPDMFPDHGNCYDYAVPGEPEDVLRTSTGYALMNPEYKQLLEAYISLAKCHGKKRDTIVVHCNLTSYFLRHLQEMGIHRLEDATESSVISFFYEDENYEKQIRSYSYKEKLTVVFKNCETADIYSAGCRHILNMIPAFRYVRKNVDYLTRDEAETVRDTIDSERFTHRDRAIMMLLLYTGLRACDIAAIRLSDIDWKKETIGIIQQKTAEPQMIAMLPAVGNAIFEYIKNSSFPMGTDYLFYSGVTGEKSMPAKAIANVAYKAFRLAGIRQNKGDRKGTHLFRHYTATKLLENGVDRPVISRVLGHTDPCSLGTYLHADFKHLGEYALSLEQYPVSEEVWDI